MKFMGIRFVGIFYELKHSQLKQGNTYFMVNVVLLLTNMLTNGVKEISIIKCRNLFSDRFRPQLVSCTDFLHVPTESRGQKGLQELDRISYTF